MSQTLKTHPIPQTIRHKESYQHIKDVQAYRQQPNKRLQISFAGAETPGRVDVFLLACEKDCQIDTAISDFQGI